MSNLLRLAETAIQHNQVAAYFEIASAAMLVYDYLLTFKLEVGLVWGTPWNLGRILFSLTRYLVFVDTSLLMVFHFSGGGSPFMATCRTLYFVSGWLIFWGIGIAEFVLIFRTWAIWGQNRKLAIALLIFTCLAGIPTGYLTQKGLNSVKYAQSPIPRAHSCFLIAADNGILFWDYIVILVLETIILTFTVIKGVQHYRNTSSGLIYTLYKDGILYYIYLTSFSIANVAVLAFPEHTQGATLILMQRVLHSILTARILLHLRLAGVRDRRDASTSDSPPALSSVFDTANRGQLSTVVIGVDTWFCDRESISTENYELV